MHKRFAFVREDRPKDEWLVAALCRIPIALAHNVMLLDRTGDFATVYLGPDREPAVTRDRATTNHQESAVWPELAARSNTVERLLVAEAAIGEHGMTLERLTDRFLSPPLYSRGSGSPTVYTAVYRPAAGRVDYVWPGKVVSQRFDRFEVREYTHEYDVLTGS